MKIPGVADKNWIKLNFSELEVNLIGLYEFEVKTLAPLGSEWILRATLPHDGCCPKGLALWQGARQTFEMDDGTGVVTELDFWADESQTWVEPWEQWLLGWMTALNSKEPRVYRPSGIMPKE